MSNNKMKRAKSQCCRSNINYLPGNKKGECSRCGSPSFYFSEEGQLELEHKIIIQPELSITHKLYLIGIQRAAKETSSMYIKL